MSDTYVPMISSGVAGPLGVVHLPRLWQKVSLEEKGKLASGYPEFETWVKENGKSVNRAAIEKHNAALRGYNHDDETSNGILSACGIADDASAPKDGVSLNNLDDWYEFHRAVLV